VKTHPAALAALTLSWASPLQAATGVGAGDALRATLALVFVVGLMFALAWAARRFGPVIRAERGLGVRVLGHVALGQRASLALVRLGGAILLLGVTQNSVNLLKEMEASDFESALARSQGREVEGGNP